jgi:repressor LexA
MPTCPSCGTDFQPTTQPLTLRQREVLDFILLTQATKRHAPTYREIADHFGFRSLATVHEHLTNLVEKGHLHRDHSKARSLSAVA